VTINKRINNFANGFLFLLFISCGEKKPSSGNVVPPIKIAPFEFSLVDYNYSLAYNVRYILTEKELIILYGDELERPDGKITLLEKKNNVLLDTILPPSEDLLRLSRIDLDSLKSLYSNDCISDGMQLMVQFKKDNKEKKIRIRNYHQPEIGSAIETINSIVPEKYKIHYDKNSLIKEMEECK